MHGNSVGYLLMLLVFSTIFNPVTTQCLYPQWETTCQRFCLANQFYNIQTNQCWSQDPSDLHCKCNNQDFTGINQGYGYSWERSTLNTKQPIDVGISTLDERQ